MTLRRVTAGMAPPKVAAMCVPGWFSRATRWTLPPASEQFPGSSKLCGEPEASVVFNTACTRCCKRRQSVPGSEGAAAGGGLIRRGGYTGFVHLQVPQPLRRGKLFLRTCVTSRLIHGILPTSNVPKRLAAMFSRALSWRRSCVTLARVPAPFFPSKVEFYMATTCREVSRPGRGFSPLLLPSPLANSHPLFLLTRFLCQSYSNIRILPVTLATPAAASMRRPLEDYVVEDPGGGCGEASSVLRLHMTTNCGGRTVFAPYRWSACDLELFCQRAFLLRLGK